MSQEMLPGGVTAPTLIDCYTSSGGTALENTYETMYCQIFEALSRGTAEETKRQLSSFYELADSLALYLNVVQQTKEEKTAEISGQMKAYYFGQMKAGTDLLADMARLERERADSQSLSGRFKYLNACLMIVGANPGIPGTELKKHLKISDSAFSNFMKRIESKNLFYIQKDGNTKYYMLSPRGRRFLQDIGGADKSSKGLYEEKFIIYLLEAIADEVLENKPNATHVILQANRRRADGVLLGNTQLIKKLILQIFEAFEKDITRRLLESARHSSMKKKRYDFYIDREANDRSAYLVYEPILDSEWG